MTAAWLEDAQVATEQARRSLHAFVREVWPLIERRPFVDNWHIGAICEALEAVSAGEIDQLIINVPPRSSKSLLTQVFWPAWSWLASPESQWLFAAYSDTLAVKHSVVCRRLIQSEGVRTASAGELPWIRRIGYRGMLGLLGQDWELAVDESLKTRFSNTETGIRIATSVGGTATGEGGDFLVVDDALKAEDARSQVMRDGANEWFDETFSTRTNSPSAAFVVIGQRLHESDLPGHLLGRGGWEHLCLPGEFEPKHPFLWPRDPRTVPGEPLDLERLPVSQLAKWRLRLGSFGFAGQIQQLPVPAEGGLFKREWWRRWTPERLESFAGTFDSVVASWDLRFSDSQAASTSYVVGQAWGCFGADRFLLGQVRARLSFTESVRAVLAMLAWMPEIRASLIEAKANGPALMSALGSRVSGLIAVEPGGSKEARAFAVQPQVEARNVYLPPGEWIPAPPGFALTSVEEFISELASFPKGTHDDQVDALSQALNWLRGRQALHGWTESVREANAEASAHRRWLDEGGTERWLEHGLGGRRVFGLEPEISDGASSSRRSAGELVGGATFASHASYAAWSVRKSGGRP